MLLCREGNQIRLYCTSFSKGQEMNTAAPYQASMYYRSRDDFLQPGVGSDSRRHEWDSKTIFVVYFYTLYPAAGRLPLRSRVSHSQIEARRPPTMGGVGRGVAQVRWASPPWRASVCGRAGRRRW